MNNRYLLLLLCSLLNACASVQQRSAPAEVVSEVTPRSAPHQRLGDDPGSLLARADELWRQGKRSEATALYTRVREDYKLSLTYLLNKDRIKDRSNEAVLPCVTTERIGSAPLAAAPETAPARPALTDDETAKNRARPYVEGLAALEQFRASTGCDEPHAQEVLDRIAKLREDVEMFHAVGSFAQYEREQRDRHTGLAFAFADEALKRGCLDAADRVYRDVFSFYVGASYSGIRDRAKLGIEDVRARRTQGSGGQR